MRWRGLLAVVAVAAAALAYVGWTAGVDAWQRRAAEQRQVSPGDLALPAVVYDPPQVLPDTEHNGPPGPVALAFRGREARHDLTETVRHPWIVVSAYDGSYRVLRAPGLPGPGQGRVVVAPDGSALAWGVPGGVVVYDPVTGRWRRLAGDLPGRPQGLVWTPDGRRLAMLAGAVQVLDVGSGRFTAVPAVPDDADPHLTFTGDSDTLLAVHPGGVLLVDWQRDAGIAVRQQLGDVIGAAADPRGERLAVLVRERFAHPVLVLRPRAGNTEPLRMAPPRLFNQQLVGWSGQEAVAVVAVQADTASWPSVYRVRLDRSYELMIALPSPPGENWTGADTLSVATGLLDRPVRDTGEPQWQWDPRAKLAAVSIAALLVVGYLVVWRHRPRPR